MDNHSDNYIVSEGKHEAIITEEMWKEAQEKRKKTGIRFYNKESKNPNVHNMFNQIARCPECGCGVVASQNQYKKQDGTKTVYYQYICGYYNNHKNGKCHKNMIRAEYLEDEVFKAIFDCVRQTEVIELVIQDMGLDIENLEQKRRKLEL